MIETFYGRDGVHPDPYLTRKPLMPRTRRGQLCLHIFHRGDNDPDPHDHPWPFWTFPLSSGYYEEVMDLVTGIVEVRHVRRWRWTRREAWYSHRVLYPDVDDRGRDPRYTYTSGEAMRKWAKWPLITLVWLGPSANRRDWGFWVPRPEAKRLGLPTGGLTTTRAWVPWRDYIFGERDERR